MFRSKESGAGSWGADLCTLLSSWRLWGWNMKAGSSVSLSVRSKQQSEWCFSGTCEPELGARPAPRATVHSGCDLSPCPPWAWCFPHPPAFSFFSSREGGEDGVNFRLRTTGSLRGCGCWLRQALTGQHQDWVIFAC